jgi:hypothetical protein
MDEVVKKSADSVEAVAFEPAWPAEAPSDKLTEDKED